jgi:hypothetical protein
MHNTTHSPLLSLPAELRLEIYAHIIPPIPLAEPRSHYAGLIYTCAQLRLEFEPLIVKRMQYILSDLARQAYEGWNQDAITFSPFRTLHELENLTVSACTAFSRRVITVDWFASPGGSRFDAPLRDLPMWHFESLTINVSPQRRTAEDEGKQKMWLRWMLAHFTVEQEASRRPNVRRFRLDWSAAFPCASNHTWPVRGMALEEMFERKVWRMRFEMDGEGRQVAVGLEWRAIVGAGDDELHGYERDCSSMGTCDACRSLE